MSNDLIKDMNEFLKELRLKSKNKKIKVKEVYLPRDLFVTLVKNMNKRTFPKTKKDLLLNITINAYDAKKIKYLETNG